MIKRACLLSILALAAAVTMSSCGGGGGSAPITVNITTNVMNIETFQTVQFAATVTGTSNTAVTWQLSCNTLPVSVCGTMSTSGLYVAPNTVPTLATVNSTDAAQLIVTAISQANTSISQSVGFTIDSLNMQPLTAPVQLGSSGGSAKAICLTPAPGSCFGGTLGSLLTNGTNLFILSNNHVLGLSDGGAVGQEVTQPGVIETNCSLTGTINVATVSTIINLQTQPIPAFPVDVTTAQIINGQVDPNDNVLELGALSTVNGVQVPQPAPPAAGSGITTAVGKLLAKSGRTTGLTCSAVDATDVSMVVVQYESGCSTTPFNVTYNDEITVANMSNGQNFIGDGDSGSLAVDEATAQPVALLFAGSDTEAVGNPVADVLNALHTSTGHTYSFVGGAQHTVPGCSLPGLSSVKVTPQSAAAISAGTAQRGQAAAASYSTQIMNTPGVSAYGGGGSLDAPQEPAVMIFVAPGASHANIPATIDGVRTRVVESSSTTAHGPLTSQQTAELASQSAQEQTVTISDAALAQTKSIKEQHVASLMSDPAVIGVGVSASLDSPGDPALMIYVLKGKAHSAIPATIDGVRTRIKETGPFRANVAHPLKSTATGAGCRVPKSTPTTGLNATPTALNAAPATPTSGSTGE
jgi:hypothetical protein